MEVWELWCLDWNESRIASGLRRQPCAKGLEFAWPGSATLLDELLVINSLQPFRTTVKQYLLDFNCIFHKPETVATVSQSLRSDYLHTRFSPSSNIALNSPDSSLCCFKCIPPIRSPRSLAPNLLNGNPIAYPAPNKHNRIPGVSINHQWWLWR